MGGSVAESRVRLVGYIVRWITEFMTADWGRTVAGTLAAAAKIPASAAVGAAALVGKTAQNNRSSLILHRTPSLSRQASINRQIQQQQQLQQQMDGSGGASAAAGLANGATGTMSSGSSFYSAKETGGATGTGGANASNASTLKTDRENIRLCLNVIAELVDYLQRTVHIRNKNRGEKSETETMIMHLTGLLPKLFEAFGDMVWAENVGAAAAAGLALPPPPSALGSGSGGATVGGSTEGQWGSGSMYSLGSPASSTFSLPGLVSGAAGGEVGSGAYKIPTSPSATSLTSLGAMGSGTPTIPMSPLASPHPLDTAATGSMTGDAFPFPSTPLSPGFGSPVGGSSGDLNAPTSMGFSAPNGLSFAARLGASMYGMDSVGGRGESVIGSGAGGSGAGSGGVGYALLPGSPELTELAVILVAVLHILSEDRISMFLRGQITAAAIALMQQQQDAEQRQRVTRSSAVDGTATPSAYDLITDKETTSPQQPLQQPLHLFSSTPIPQTVLNGEQVAHTLSMVFTAMQALIHGAFPQTWPTMNMLALKTVVKVLKPVGELLREEFTPYHPEQRVMHLQHEMMQQQDQSAFVSPPKSPYRPQPLPAKSGTTSPNSPNNVQQSSASIMSSASSILSSSEKPGNADAPTTRISGSNLPSPDSPASTPPRIQYRQPFPSIPPPLATAAPATNATTNAAGAGTALSAMAAAEQFAINQMLWADYFRVLLQLLNSKWVQIERFGPQRMRLAAELGADVRGEGGVLLKTMWDHLAAKDDEVEQLQATVTTLASRMSSEIEQGVGQTGPTNPPSSWSSPAPPSTQPPHQQQQLQQYRAGVAQLQFIPGLVGPFLELTMSPHPVLSTCSVELLFSSIQREFVAVGEISRIEAECIDRIDRLVMVEGKGDEAYRRFVVDSLGRKFDETAVLAAASMSASAPPDPSTQSTTTAMMGDGERSGDVEVETIGVEEQQEQGEVSEAAGEENVDVESNAASSSTQRPLSLLSSSRQLKPKRRSAVPLASLGRFTVLGLSFLKSLDRFLELCLTIRDLPPGEEHDDERMAAILKLMRFVRAIGHRGIYVKYAHQLSRLHLEHGNYVEAALALKLHADLLQWNHDTIIEPLPEYNFMNWETPFDRKEQLYVQCLDYLERGKAWERAVELLRELAQQYERGFALDYSKLANTLQRQAELSEKIWKAAERYPPTYYRVHFHGKGWPPLLRGKQFVYLAGEWERLASFCDRVLNKYTTAQLVRSNGPVDASVSEGQGLFLQIIAVKAKLDPRRWVGPSGFCGWPLQWENSTPPMSNNGLVDNVGNAMTSNVNNPADTSSSVAHQRRSRRISTLSISHFEEQLPEPPEIPLSFLEPDLEPDMMSDAAQFTALLERVPECVRSYYEGNEVNIFTYSRPIRRPIRKEGSNKGEDGKKPTEPDPAQEFLELWTEKTVLITEESFPCLLRRSEVIKCWTFHLSPIENAVIAVREKNKQLLALEKKYTPYSLDADSSTIAVGSSAGLRGAARPNSSGGVNASQPINVNPFTMALNGAVDAPVNGGVPMYKRAFINAEYRAANPDQAHLVDLLEKAIEEQVEIIHRCIILHDRIVPSEMRPLHENLITFFQKNFSEEISRLQLRVRPHAKPSLPQLDTSGLPAAGGLASPSGKSIRGRRSSASGAATDDFVFIGGSTSGSEKRDSGSRSRTNVLSTLFVDGTVKIGNFMSSVSGGSKNVSSASISSGGGHDTHIAAGRESYDRSSLRHSRALSTSSQTTLGRDSASLSRRDSVSSPTLQLNLMSLNSPVLSLGSAYSPAASPVAEYGTLSYTGGPMEEGGGSSTRDHRRQSIMNFAGFFSSRGEIVPPVPPIPANYATAGRQAQFYGYAGTSGDLGSASMNAPGGGAASSSSTVANPSSSTPSLGLSSQWASAPVSSSSTAKRYSVNSINSNSSNISLVSNGSGPVVPIATNIGTGRASIGSNSGSVGVGTAGGSEGLANGGGSGRSSGNWGGEGKKGFGVLQKFLERW
ncbi:hypothetical protein HK102_000486 [Quaeritorhiza haematococci]|nr:hypothetical protein HK102_000486 [Quaeritorhiza haematococci]